MAEQGPGCGEQPGQSWAEGWTPPCAPRGSLTGHAEVEATGRGWLEAASRDPQSAGLLAGGVFPVKLAAAHHREGGGDCVLHPQGSLCPRREATMQTAHGYCPGSPPDAGDERGLGLCRGEVDFGGSGKKRSKVGRPHAPRHARNPRVHLLSWKQGLLSLSPGATVPQGQGQGPQTREADFQSGGLGWLSSTLRSNWNCPRPT